MEEGFLYRREQVFISRCAAQRNYAGAPGGSHLRGTWQACNILRVVPASPDFNNKDKSFKTNLMFVSLPSAD